MFGIKLPVSIFGGNTKDHEDDKSYHMSESLIHNGAAHEGEHDTSPQAKARRTKAMMRAVYAEFVGTILFFLPIFAVLANNHQEGFTGAFNRMSAGIIAGLNLICIIMCFSSLSGAIFNPAIVFSLWLVGKMSNRKCITFMVVEMLASLACMAIIWATFPTVNQGLWDSFVLHPPDGASSWNVFFTEFVCTFILTFCAFALAFEEAESVKPASMSVQAVQASDGLVVYGSTPQSKLGFAPFALGFLVFVLSQYGGGSGPSMNPVRMFGPSIMTGRWDSWIYYVLGDYLGAGAGALAVMYGPQVGERPVPHNPPTDTRRSSTRISLTTTPLSGTAVNLVPPVSDKV